MRTDERGRAKRTENEEMEQVKGKRGGDRKQGRERKPERETHMG